MLAGATARYVYRYDLLLKFEYSSPELFYNNSEAKPSELLKKILEEMLHCYW